MATALIRKPIGLVRIYLQWSGLRTLRRVVEQAHAEIIWLRSQVALLQSANKRISEVNDQFSIEMAALREQVAKLKVIDPTHPCSVCGNRAGNKLKALTEGIVNQKGRVVVQLTCALCSFQQALEPVTENAFDVWQPTPGEEDVQRGILGL